MAVVESRRRKRKKKVLRRKLKSKLKLTRKYIIKDHIVYNYSHNRPVPKQQ